ncbi:MAG: MFS transporter [Candidatus Gygaella obscura]|nr:MFS transporter [Candidatus Gygaella obscura]
MSKFKNLFTNRNFILLWLGQIISQWGDRLGQIALIAFVYERSPGSPLEMAKILSFTIIPVFLIGPIAGVYVDRWDRRKTMFVTDFLRSILVLIIPLFLFRLGSDIPLYIVIFLIFCIGRFFVPAKLAIIPDLVQEKELLLTNSLVNTTGMIAAVLGFGLGGILVEWWSSQAGFYLDALSFFISAILILLINPRKIITSLPKDFAQQSSRFVKDISKSVIQEIKEGIGYIVKVKEVRFTTGILFLLWSALGSVYVVLIVFIQNALQSATKDLGLLIMFLGLGLFLGTVIYGRFGQKFSLYKAMFVFLFLSGFQLIVFTLVLNKFPDFAVASVLVVLLGIVISPIMNIANTLIHSASQTEMRGKVFSSLEIVIHFAFLIFMFISSFIAEYFNATSVMVIVGSLLCVVSVYNLVKKQLINDPFKG